MEFNNEFVGIKNNICPIRRISPNNGDYFFGYYDLPAYSLSGETHLAYKMPFIDRLNTKDDKVLMGTIKNGEFTPFAENDCWNFQQGSMLQYKFGSEDTVFYNTYNKEENEYHTVRRNLTSGETVILPGASANISRGGRYGLSVNFNRIWDFRPGYGYCHRVDPLFDIPKPFNDGVFLCDFLTGEKKLIISYERMLKEFPIKGKEKAKFVINHITFNPSGNRFLMLLRNFVEGKGVFWGTSLITSDLDGNMTMLYSDTVFSHYWWANDNEVIAFCTPFDRNEGKLSLYCFDALDGSFEELAQDGLSNAGDIHCSLSPDSKYLIGDGYSDETAYRHLWIKNMQTGKEELLLSAKSRLNDWADTRCDLHARFNYAGDRISFDNYNDGKREILEIDMTGFNL